MVVGCLQNVSGVRQGGKIRAVDDFSEFLINASVTSTEKLQLFGLDEVVNTARTLLDVIFLGLTTSWKICGVTRPCASSKVPGLTSWEERWI